MPFAAKDFLEGYVCFDVDEAHGEIPFGREEGKTRELRRFPVMNLAIVCFCRSGFNPTSVTASG